MGANVRVLLSEAAAKQSYRDFSSGVYFSVPRAVGTTIFRTDCQHGGPSREQVYFPVHVHVKPSRYAGRIREVSSLAERSVLGNSHGDPLLSRHWGKVKASVSSAKMTSIDTKVGMDFTAAPDHV